MWLNDVLKMKDVLVMLWCIVLTWRIDDVLMMCMFNMYACFSKIVIMTMMMACNGKWCGLMPCVCSVVLLHIDVAYIAFGVIILMLHVMLSDVMLPCEDCDAFDYGLMCFDEWR